MNDKERCVICSNEISTSMDICPYCGTIIHKDDYHIDKTNRYDFDRDKNLEYLEKMDITLCHLEEELDAILCKKH